MSDSSNKLIELKNLSHDSLIDLVKMFAPGVSSNGVCNGFTSMWLQAVVTNKKAENRFYARLDLISDVLKESVIGWIKDYLQRFFYRINYNPELATWGLDIRAFAENVAIQQTPGILNTPGNKHIRQSDKKILYPLTASKKLNKKNIILNYEHIDTLMLNQEELEKCFTEIQNKLIELEIKEVVGFKISSDVHSTGVYFNAENQNWCHLDIEHLSGETTYYAEANPKALAKLILDTASPNKTAISKYTGFMLSVLSPEQRPELITQLKTITNKYFTLEERKNSTGSDLLFIACFYGDLNIVKKILDNEKILININTKRPYFNMTPLYAACQESHIEIVKALLEKGANTDDKNYIDNTTGLMIACWSGYEKIVALLLKFDGKNSINENDSTVYHSTALDYACLNNHPKIVDLLLKNGAQTDSYSILARYISREINSSTLMRYCCANGYTDALKAFIKHGVTDNLQKCTELAKKHNKEDVLAVLLENADKIEKKQEINKEIIFSKKRKRDESVVVSDTLIKRRKPNHSDDDNIIDDQQKCKIM